MKAAFEKMKEQFGEALELMKTQKTDEAMEKLEACAKTIDDATPEVEAAMEKVAKAEEMQKTIDEGATAEEMAKTASDTAESLAKTAEKMEKWANVNVSGESLTEALKDIKESVSAGFGKQKEELEKSISEIEVGTQQVTKTTWDEPKAGIWDNLDPR